MLLVEHKINTVERLRAVSPERGVEVDIRDYDGDLRLVHDPFLDGVRVEDFLAAYQHSLLIFNLKCDGLAEPVMELAEKYRIHNYFFLDLTNPTMINLVRRGFKKIAVRYSEYEPLEFALKYAGKVDWVWVDCFTRLPLDSESYRRLRENFKVCLVSPELQKHPRSAIQLYREQLHHMPIDAVCSDYCDDWV
jgi:hypothetical protein